MGVGCKKRVSEGRRGGQGTTLLFGGKQNTHLWTNHRKYIIKRLQDTRLTHRTLTLKVAARWGRGLKHNRERPEQNTTSQTLTWRQPNVFRTSPKPHSSSQGGATGEVLAGHFNRANPPLQGKNRTLKQTRGDVPQSFPDVRQLGQLTPRMDPRPDPELTN